MSIQRPHFAHEVNATGTLNVLEAARYLGIDRVVIASSAAVYGAPHHLPLAEDDPVEPLSPYAAQKWLAEAYARTYAELHGMSPICLRYFNVFGPRQDPASPYSGVLSRFIGSALAGEEATIHGDGRQTRDFVYVQDVARANVRALLAPEPAPGLLFNVGTGRAVSVAEAHGLIARLTGAPAAGRAPGRAGDVPHSRADITRARRLLGYEPKVAFEAGLEATLAWAQQRLVPALPLSA
jgi:UDP-glucose 4-epimerase